MSATSEAAHEKGLAAARAVAGYHIGDRSWADLLVDAYLNPDKAMAALQREKSTNNTTQEYR